MKVQRYNHKYFRFILKAILGTIFIIILGISLLRMTCHQEKLSYKCRNRREFCGCITFEIIMLTYIEVLKCGKMIRIRSKTRNKMLIYWNRYACDICKLVDIRNVMSQTILFVEFWLWQTSMLILISFKIRDLSIRLTNIIFPHMRSWSKYALRYTSKFCYL